MPLVIADARTWIRDYARNAGDSTEYPDARIDRAFMYVGTEFVKFTRCTRSTSPAALANNSAAVVISSITGFRPEYLIGDPKVWVTVSGAVTARVDVVAREEVFRRQLECPQTTAPKSCQSKIAFLGNTAADGAVIYPTIPNDAVSYVLNLMWDPPFPVWTPGGTPGGFLIPDEYLIPLLTLYIPRALQHNEPEHVYAADRDAEFMAYCQKCAGKGGTGETSIQREPVSRWGRW